MKPFTYERAQLARRAPPPPRATPGAKFIAGGTNLLDLMKLRDRDADPSDRRQRSAARQDRSDARTAACASARWCATPISPPIARVRTRLSAAVARAARRRLGAAAQQGDHRRQPAAAHPLPVFLRHRSALQQAPARLRLRGARRLQPRQLPSSAAATPASPPIRATWRSRWWRSTPRSRRCAPTAATRRFPIADFHRAARRHARSSRPCSSPAN